MKMSLAFVLALCAIPVLFVSGCVLSYPLEYTVQTSDCDRSLTEGYYNLNQTRNNFILEYVRSYHCTGSELNVMMYMNLSKMIVAEELLVGELTTVCVCPRMVTISVKHMRSGNYTIEMRNYNYRSSKEPAFTQDISV